MEQQILVKSEMESNGELLVFYVDENGGQEGVLTTIEAFQGELPQLGQENYIIGEVDETVAGQVIQNEIDSLGASNENCLWSDDEIKKLLVFYIDNKEAFLNGTTKKMHLWTVACKVILTGKSPAACDTKLRNLMRSYVSIRFDHMKGKNVYAWPYYDLCHQAFHDDKNVNVLLNEETMKQDKALNVQSVLISNNDDGIVIHKRPTNSRTSLNEKVEQMLNLYLEHKNRLLKDYWQKQFWDSVAAEMGEDGEYWHKRFLNFKQHYIRMVYKRQESGADSINWPYMKLFDQIYEDDKEFLQKHGVATNSSVSVKSATETIVEKVSAQPIDWDETEKTVLVKYCFDCFDEFQDTTIPNSFLWTEVGRLLDKTAEVCKQKYEALKLNHINLLLSEGYNFPKRRPIEILFDNIISKETELRLNKGPLLTKQLEVWKTEEIDLLVQYIYDNVELFKDPVCHFVCWTIVGMKLKRSVPVCRVQWLDLTSVYKTILDDKKENPDMEIDWRYIEIFDRIFDYGMDTKLLDGYEISIELTNKGTEKVGVKKLNISLKEEVSANGTDDEEYDERGFVKRSKGTGDSKSFKILEFYQKNKDKFSTTQRKKQALWEVLAKQIGISAEQCAHRFRNLKQVYIAYVQREISKPEKPILWPYYTLCKKVFGYRAIKSKLKNDKMDSDEDDWSPSDINKLIDHISHNFDAVNSNAENRSLWSPLAGNLGKSEIACKDKFLELRKSYRKIKTRLSKNPDCKVNWQYFKMFDDIYTGPRPVKMDVEEKFYMTLELPNPDTSVKAEAQEDDDYQCIIVLPEGDDLTNADIPNAQIIIKNSPDAEVKVQDEKLRQKREPWTPQTKKLLLNTFLKCMKEHEGQIMNTREIWPAIAKSLPCKTVIGCQRMYRQMKANHNAKLASNNEPYKKTFSFRLFNKIMALKPKFHRTPLSIENIELQEMKTYRDVALPLWRVEQALKYYIEHIEEFISPKYVKKYAWKDLANSTELTMGKIFKKINYLKQLFSQETEEKDIGENKEFGPLIKEIFEKEFIVKIALANDTKPMTIDEGPEPVWTDDEVEKLLNWYLENLDRFKNPKFVPSYLWMEASNVLQNSPLACSKKMSEIRTQYSNMVKESPESLNDWKFHELCQKIYGTGKKNVPVNANV